MWVLTKILKATAAFLSSLPKNVAQKDFVTPQIYLSTQLCLHQSYNVFLHLCYQRMSSVKFSTQSWTVYFPVFSSLFILMAYLSQIELVMLSLNAEMWSLRQCKWTCKKNSLIMSLFVKCDFKGFLHVDVEQAAEVTVTFTHSKTIL